MKPTRFRYRTSCLTIIKSCCRSILWWLANNSSFNSSSNSMLKTSFFFTSFFLLLLSKSTHYLVCFLIQILILTVNQLILPKLFFFIVWLRSLFFIFIFKIEIYFSSNFFRLGIIDLQKKNSTFNKKSNSVADFLYKYMY